MYDDYEVGQSLAPLAFFVCRSHLTHALCIQFVHLEVQQLYHGRTQTYMNMYDFMYYARSKYRTQLAEMTFDEILDVAAEVSWLIFLQT